VEIILVAGAIVFVAWLMLMTEFFPGRLNRNKNDNTILGKCPNCGFNISTLRPSPYSLFSSAFEFISGGEQNWEFPKNCPECGGELQPNK